MGIRLREKLVRLWQMVVFLFLIPGLRGEEGMIIGDSVRGDGAEGERKESKQPKLLVIMIDGFRYDYLDLHPQETDAFDEFLVDGVRAEWLEPVFPSSSYPNWHSVSTGLYPESHGILGNFMYDQRVDSVFDLNYPASTKQPGWWQEAEPIWISATRERKRVFLRYWSRCDVPFEDTFPNGEFSGYRSEAGIQAFQKTLNVTLQKLKDNDLLMVYNEHVDNIGHQYGPGSANMVLALKEVNRVFKWFLDRLYDEHPDIEKELNIIILSDHGMDESGSESNVTTVSLKYHLDPNHVIKLVDSGSMVGIFPLPRHSDEVYDRLKRVDGIDVYKREEIPTEFHYKNHRLAPEILVLAKPGYHIQGLPQEMSQGMDRYRYLKQIPLGSGEPRRRSGSHGYVNRTEMNGIFFAKGPQFKAGLLHPPIRMVDVYMIMTRVLGIRELPHNGTWARVSGMFVNTSSRKQFWNTCFILNIVFVLIQ